MDNLFITWLATTAIVLATILLYTSWNKLIRSRRPRRAQLPRGTFGWPLLGETLDFVSCAYSPRPESFMDKRRLLYGKVFKSHIFGSPTIVSTDAEVSRFVLQSDAKTFVPWYPKSLTELMGKSSILLINGSLQKKVHGLIGAFFKSPHLKAQITRDMQSYVLEAMSHWKDDQLIHIQDESKRIVFQILVRGLIGLEPGEEMNFLKQQFREFIAGLMSLPLKLPGSRLYRSLQAKKRMVMLIEKIIQEKKKNKNGCTQRDVVDVLINDASDQLTDDLISDNMIDLMIPAEDSVPVLVTLAIKYLSECLPALQYLEEENMNLKKEKSVTGENLQWTDYMSLSFTQDVITETLRMGNIISGIMRKAVKDVEIKGHFIPKGWCVLTYFRSVHLDESLYKEAYKFDPWRWKVRGRALSFGQRESKGREGRVLVNFMHYYYSLDLLLGYLSAILLLLLLLLLPLLLSGAPQDKDMGTCSFTPFGGGQRLCPGLDLARLEASIFLHHLVTGFT